MTRRSRAVLLGAYFLAQLLVCGAARAAGWIASVDTRHGMPVVSRDGSSAVSGAFAFWGKNWAWANPQVQFRVTAPFQYSVVGRNQTLDFEFTGTVRRQTGQQLVWDYDINARSATPDAVGGGMVFRFDLAAFGAELGEPQILPGNSGWSWGRTGEGRMEMRFDPPMAAMYFERGQKSELRAFIFKDGVPQGRRRQTATLTLSGDMLVGPTVAESFGMDDFTAWPTDVLDWKTSPVNLAYLNAPEKPAGKRGFLKAAGEKLVFGDGTTARFWGTNLSAHALFGTSPENMRQQARRLSELGFNLVRLHHHDSPWVNPNIFGDRAASDTQSLSPAMLDKLDWWIKCLKDEGIYVWLDLHVGRQFKAGDGIEDFDEIAKGGPMAEIKGFRPMAEAKGYSYVNPSMRLAMKRFNEAYVNHLSSYTGLRYKDEPAIVAMLITNENDVTSHWGHALLPDKNVPRHNALYTTLAGAFAEKHGVPKDRVWRSWEPGPSKLFLNDLERRFNVEMLAHLRAQGVRVPIATTSTWGMGPLSSLPALTSGEIIDAHAYGGIGELSRNPLQAPNLVHWLAAARVAGKPLSVTEWNVEAFPAPDRHAIALYVAASAAHQGWNALMQYAYSQAPLNGPGVPSNWHSYNDPALIATLPAGALMYREGHVSEASTTYAFAPSGDQLFNQGISPHNSAGLRTAAEKGKLLIVLPQVRELPWLEKGVVPAGARLIADPSQSLLGPVATESVSDTGELTRNWAQGIFAINTPRSQGAAGWIGGRAIRLPDVEISVSTRSASVIVQSMDGKPIRESAQLLLSMGARSTPVSEQRLPFHSEPVVGQISLRARSGLRLYRRDPFTGEENVLPAPYSGGRYAINMDRSIRTYWLTLK